MKNMKRRIAALITSLLWGFFTYTGYTLTSAVAQRHIRGYPNAGQWHYYVYFPLMMLIVSFGLLLLGKRLPVTLFATMWILQVLVIVPFLFGYGGGV
jgi:hypothetical protein